jgi:hypothetical protein
VKGIAGLREQRTNPRTGQKVGLYDGEPAGMDTAGGRWQTVCEEHGSICSHSTKRVARTFLAAPWEWCELCAEELDGPLEVGGEATCA